MLRQPKSQINSTFYAASNIFTCTKRFADIPVDCGQPWRIHNSGELFIQRENLENLQETYGHVFLCGMPKSSCGEAGTSTIEEPVHLPAGHATHAGATVQRR